VIERVDAGIMPVAPLDSHGVVTHFLNVQHFQGRLKHLEWIFFLRGVLASLRIRTMRASARGAGTFVAKIG
jgi:hypothetical protein